MSGIVDKCITYCVMQHCKLLLSCFLQDCAVRLFFAELPFCCVVSWLQDCCSCLLITCCSCHAPGGFAIGLAPADLALCFGSEYKSLACNICLSCLLPRLPCSLHHSALNKTCTSHTSKQTLQLTVPQEASPCARTP